MRNLLRHALLFATEKYKETGKLYNGQPYIVHLILTSQIVELVAPYDKKLIAAAYLHDILEDTEITYDQLIGEFGEEIAGLVFEVTKDENKDFPHLKTERGLLLKVADRLANVSSASHTEHRTRREKLFEKYSFCFKHEGTHHENIK